MALETDFLIVGSGIAALRAAVAVALAGEITILTKGATSEGSTGYAQGGIAAAVGPDDSSALHEADTLLAGDGLCDERAVEVLVHEGPRYVRELLAWGARFDRDASGEPELAREGAHSVRRVLHARDATGREIARTLWQKTVAVARPHVVEHAAVVEALVEGDRCAGMRFIDSEGRVQMIRARASLLATGGAGQLYRETTNPPVATGDGIAVGYRAGARVTDLEFVQFHPTALNVTDMPRFLLSEALRGEGARLVNDSGEAFMRREDPMADLAPRDRVARAIVREVQRTGAPVYLSLAHLASGFVHERFPEISAAVRQAGLDLARDPVPVGPAAHYLMGGVWTDLEGRTSVPSLFAAGEVACTGVHGANRLASNSLLEGLVFGARAGAAMAAFAAAAKSPAGETTWSGDVVTRAVAYPDAERVFAIPIGAAEIRDTMWRQVGLFRDRAGLDAAVSRLSRAAEAIQQARREAAGFDPQGWQVANMVTVAALIAGAARRREESRGAHFRSDYPARDDRNWQRHVFDTVHDG